MLPFVASGPAVLAAVRVVGPVVLRGMVLYGPPLLFAGSVCLSRQTVAWALADRIRQPGTRVRYTIGPDGSVVVEIEPASPEA